MAEENPEISLGQHMLKTVWIFQAVTAAPILVFLGGSAFAELFSRWLDFYDFFSDSITALMSAAIIFIVIIQRRTSVSTFLTFQFEATKSVLATGLWLWLILDSAFGPWQWRYSDHMRDSERTQRIVRSAVAILLLLILFYPSTIYSYLQWRDSKLDGDVDEEAGPADEQTPLLNPPRD